MVLEYNYILYICEGVFRDEKSNLPVTYYKALVKRVKGDTVSYELVKASPDWAKNFKDFNNSVLLYYDRYGRVQSSQFAGD